MRDAIQQADSGENGHGDLKEVPKPGNKTVNGMNGSNGVMEPPKRFTNAVKFNHNFLAVTQTALIQRLYSTSVEAKIWGVASKALGHDNPPRFYPEYTKPGGNLYVYREFDFWTSGFFPGCLYLLLERRKKYPHLQEPGVGRPHFIQLQQACAWWTERLHQNALLKETHDLGFMIMPWARPAWEMNHDTRAFDTLKTAANNLLARFSPAIGCMRSWDICKTKRYSFEDPGADFLVIIDNMMNLSLLFLVAEQTNDHRMRDAAIEHAKTTARIHVRPDASTTHLVVFNPVTGDVKDRLTNQGFSHTSCWTRGQAWAIAGFAETFQWTQDKTFLLTARRCADYFLEHLPASGIAPWDFDASSQSPPSEMQPPDTSATIIAAYGMLLIHKGLTAAGEHSRYLTAALHLAEAVSAIHLNPPAQYSTTTGDIETAEYGIIRSSPRLVVDMGSTETIINGATINNYEFAPRRWADHGLVYADYFFILFGNELLKMDLGSLL